MMLVVFDMDGTLVDSGAAITARVIGAFAALGLAAPEPAVIRAHVGLSLQLYMAAVAGTDDPELVDRLIVAYRAIGAAAPAGQMPLFDRARAVLDRLRDRGDMQLAVATGKGRAGLDRVLEQNDIGGYFISLQTPDNNPSKPHPGMLLSAMHEAGVEPHATVMIGDAVFDIEMAHAAGVASIGVSWGMQAPDDLRRAGASMIIERFDQLEAAIDTVLEASHARPA